MSIRSKMGVILVCAVVCFSVAEYCVQQWVILPGFLSLEHDEAVKDTGRVVKAINNEIKHLNMLGADWSAWDDTYNFVNTHSGAYISSNLVLSTFTDNRLNLIYICDLQGHVVWGRVYDLAEEKEIKLDLFPKDMLPPDHPLLLSGKPHVSESGIKGLLITKAGPIAVSATPILMSNDEGPSRGTLIMGRFLDKNLQKQLAEQTQVDFSLAALPGTSGSGISAQNEESPFEVDVVDDNLLKVHAEFPDITGNSAVTITTNTQRKISQKGYGTLHNGIFSILAAGMGILILVLLSLKQSILKPIAVLNRHVLSIKKTGDLSKRLPFAGNDEIGTLANEFDQMVSRMEAIVIENDDVNKKLRKDIVKRQQVEAALAESEKRFRAMVEQAGDAVFLHDLKGNFRIVNQVACDRLGYEKSMLLTLSMMDVEPNAALRKGGHDIWKQINPNESIVFETQYRCKDDTFIPMEVSMSSIRYGGENLILAIARDMTERKQIDNRMRQKVKMEAMTTLTAGIAHNFNNILSVIVGCTELAVARLPKDNHAIKLLKKVEDASARARDIVWQLIRFSQKYEDNFTSVHLCGVVEREIQRIDSNVSNKIRIISQLQKDCFPILGDLSQLRILVENLLTNAVESIKNDRGVIEVQLENISDPHTVHIRNVVLEDGDYIRLTIRDNGQGIDPSCIDRIFDPYFSTKNFADGAGMGLAVVHGIVKNHQGLINVDSKVGRGTEISLFFPAVEPDGERDAGSAKNDLISTGSDAISN